MANMTPEISNKTSVHSNDPNRSSGNGEVHLDRLARNAGQQAGAMVSDFANTTSDTLKSGRDYVRDNPAKGAVIAAATGFIAGTLMTMALRNRSH